MNNSGYINFDEGVHCGAQPGGIRPSSFFYSFVFGGSEFHEMNNQNRQVPLDGYSPHEALQKLAFL